MCNGCGCSKKKAEKPSCDKTCPVCKKPVKECTCGKKK